jgi:RNA-directed DNA polymerase
MSTTKTFGITKHEVYNAYLEVKANKGAPGVDHISIEKYEKKLKDDLYKLWNRMSSGSYFPSAVRGVDIPKGKGKTRPLGIPTVQDRIAQAVVKNRLEPELEEYFHENPYGYRPNKSAIEAVGVARKRCYKYDWVVDIDIKGYFNNIDHELLVKALEKHTQSKWILLYIKRWLKAPVQKNGKAIETLKGTPQGAVISPLLANLFLHYAFDVWMSRKHQYIPFERFADDIVCHCRTQKQAEWLMQILKNRFAECGLTLSSEKSKIAYCKDANRRGSYENEEFDFLGFTFKPRIVKSKKNEVFISFTPAVSRKAAQKLIDKIKALRVHRMTQLNLHQIAGVLNPIMRGWINYFKHYYASEMYKTITLVNRMLARWLRRKFKKLRRKRTNSFVFLENIAKSNMKLFYHWYYAKRVC